ncbi:uncharacterized protein N7515_000004 [Penicillium bovifimosum]|uniref:Uncharacterized protein n=1 Tax=Penicillium bovifimosum TaxID=126998 RepID=A0A9W9HGE3_9EURO|nr:uncharacterized protein N7515_000004 [Penicillium bovifimosum]KAJ5145440.1 hypothetical protein N7515_000004 [Penicillium bovifimosum]
MKRFKAYIEDVVTEDIVLKNMTDPGALHSYFRHNFNPGISPTCSTGFNGSWIGIRHSAWKEFHQRLHWDICQTGNYRFARGRLGGDPWSSGTKWRTDAHYDVVKPGLETFAKKFASTAIRRAKAKVERPKGPKRKIVPPHLGL